MDAPLTLPSAPSAFAASNAPDLEATIRKILAETKPAGMPKREYSHQEKEAFKQGRLRARQTRVHSQSMQHQPTRYQGQQPPQGYPRQLAPPQRPPFQPQQSRPYQDQPRNQFRQIHQDRQPQPPFVSNGDRRPQHGNKRAFAAMEYHDDYNGTEGYEGAAYGAHQEYDDDGNYQQSYHAMSAAMEPIHDYDDEDDQDGETYAS